MRYRTRDISRLTVDPCACGRTLVKMQRVTGRTDDMLIIRGVNFFPSQIESIIMKRWGVSPHYLVVVDRPGAMDEVEVRIEVNDEFMKKAAADVLAGMRAGHPGRRGDREAEEGRPRCRRHQPAGSLSSATPSNSGCCAFLCRMWPRPAG